MFCCVWKTCKLASVFVIDPSNGCRHFNEKILNQHKGIIIVYVLKRLSKVSYFKYRTLDNNLGVWKKYISTEVCKSVEVCFGNQ